MNPTDAMINELPAPWRKAAYAGIAAISITVGYFLFIAGPVSVAVTQEKADAANIDKIEGSVGSIQSDASAIKAHEAATDQKLDDVKGAADAINDKLDRLLERTQKSGK